jgi:hypothetical protein
MARVIAQRAAVDPTVPREKDDEVIEWQFVKDYGEFALQMNFPACAALLEKARILPRSIDRRKARVR